MSSSLIYRYPTVYKILMALLYGRQYRTRIQAVANKIPSGASVLDVCCGDCSLFTVSLKNRCNYIGLDSSKEFVSAALKQDIPALCADITIDSLPKSDIIVIQGSLYQFYPNHSNIVDRLIASAEQAVIISEPILNIAHSSNRYTSWVARRFVPSNSVGFRFSKESLLQFLEEHYGELIMTIEVIEGGRDLIVVLKTSEEYKID